MIITIDGPSGSGKTTLALNLAKHLHFFCMNSGYLYRSIAYILTQYYGYDEQKIQHTGKDDIEAILNSPNFRYEYEYGLIKIYWTDEITMFLKSVEISRLSAVLAQNDVAREMIKNYEKKLVGSRDTIVEGRACGSSMYPEADLKFYLDAPVHVRAQRLQKDQKKKGNDISLHDSIEQIEKRDFIDTNRKKDPLVVPQGAIVLDSSNYSADELLEHVLNYVKKYFKN